MARPNSALAVQKMKLDISVRDTITPSTSGAQVVIDWFETDRVCDLKWAKLSTYHNVQFPAPRGYPDARILILLEELLKETTKKGLHSVAFPVYDFGRLNISSFVPLLLQAALATGSDATIFLCTWGKTQCQETKDYLQSTEYQCLYDRRNSADREVLPIEYITYDLLHFYEDQALDRVKQLGCCIKYESGNLVIIGSRVQECKKIIKQAIALVNDLCTQDINTVSFDQKSLQDAIDKICMRNKKHYCCFNKANPFLLHIYGRTMASISSAKREIERVAKTSKSPGNDSANVGRDRGQNPKSAGKSRNVVLARNVRTFHTKENIKIVVYEGDIVQLNVDCIINAANIGLTNEGGLAQVIAKAAGPEFTKECKQYIKKSKFLGVGEACKTTAGKLPYKCLVHTVGPCWYDYKPLTQQSIDRCKHDLKSAVINSLKIVDGRIRSIACPSISSGKFGVPRELCCVQYAQALIEYSRETYHPLMEIHFVDKDASMVQMIGDTFDSMFNFGKPPTSYNEKVYVSQSFGTHSGAGATAGSYDKQTMRYPSWMYTTPPKWHQNEFTCTLGPNQNVYVYTGDIMKVRKIDLIVCGDVPIGKPLGYLAKSLWETCGEVYKKNKRDAFKGKSEGDIVFCRTEKYRFVGHVLLIPRDKFKSDDERRKKISQLFCTVFDGMKSRGCQTMAIPLIGTGKGHGDPVFYAERFIQSLIEFCSFQKSFIFDIHLVNFDAYKTAKAIDTIETEIRKRALPVRNPPSRPAARPADRHRANGDISRQNNAGFTAGRDNGHTGNHYKHQKERRPSTAGASKQSYKEDRYRDNGTAASKPLQSDANNHKTNFSQSQGKSDTNHHKTNFNQSQRNNQQTYDKTCASSVEEKTTPLDEPWGKIDQNKSQSERIPSNSRQQSTNSSNSPDSVNALKMNNLSVNPNPPKGNLNIFMDDDKKLTSSAVSTRTLERHCSDDDDDDDDRADTGDDDDRADTGDDDDRADTGDDDDDGWGYYDVNDDCLDDQDKRKHEASEYERQCPRVGSSSGLEEEEDMEVDNVGEAIVEPAETCVICMDTISKSNSKTLACGHEFCADCIDQQFVYKEACPTCGFVCGIITGDQPDGSMDVNINRGESCKGYEDCDRIEITYSFSNGRQGSNHPQPGKFYKGIRRTAYLPYNKQGKQILEMLKIAFDRKLIFTIGSSRTTGADSVITWNDIHHKTDPKPNTQFGYPDNTYLDRVTDELKAKGVTKDDIPTLPNRVRRR